MGLILSGTGLVFAVALFSGAIDPVDTQNLRLSRVRESTGGVVQWRNRSCAPASRAACAFLLARCGSRRQLATLADPAHLTLLV